MSLGKAVDDALDALNPDTPSGTVQAEVQGRSAQVEVADVDRIGVRVRRIRVERDRDYDVERIAEAWPRELRDLPDRVVPVEVDPRMGGASLRSDPDEMRDGRFVDIEVRGRVAEVRRRVRNRGEVRDDADFTLTREQLGRMVDDLVRGGDDRADDVPVVGRDRRR